MSSDYIDDENHTHHRTIDGGYFPMSPAANVRESIFSVVLSHILVSIPVGTEFEELNEALSEANKTDVPDELTDEVWDVFLSTYVTQGENSGNFYIIPFHPTIAQCIQPHEARNWGLWYQMLMYDRDTKSFNQRLHESLHTELNEEITASNIFEELFVKAAESIGYEETEIEETDLPPYLLACADTFQADIEAWLSESRLSSSEWLRSLRDLFCFHAMTYYVQLSINLRKEFDLLHQGGEEVDPYKPEIHSIYYGLEDERASQDRRFRTEWDERGRRGIAGDVYDSWGRLGVLHLIERSLADAGNPSLPSIATPTEFMQDEFAAVRPDCIGRIRERLRPQSRPDKSAGFPAHATAYATAVRQHYEDLPSERQTPSSLGIRVIRRLGDGNERIYIKRQRSIGTTFRLNRGSLRFFGRLFELQNDDGHFDRFITYLSNRGINLDEQSVGAVQEALDEMGMIRKKSDSGDSIYVQSI